MIENSLFDIFGQVHNLNIQVGEIRRYNITNKLHCSINIDDSQEKISLEGFDSFVFILKNDRLNEKTDLIFYNNLSDKNGIINELSETSESSDIELVIDLSKIEINSQKVEIYIKFEYAPIKKSLLDLLKKKKFLKIGFDFSIRTGDGIQIEGGFSYVENPITIKLLEITKDNQETFSIHFTSLECNRKIDEIIKERY